MQTISIIGCGWQGMSLVEHLSKSGFTVLGTTTREEKLDKINQAGGRGVLFDAGNKELTLEQVELFEADVLIYILSAAFAGRNYIRYSNDLLKNTIAHCKQGSVRKIIFTSSTGVYGNQQSEVYTEDMALEPKRPTAAAKYQGEKILMLEQELDSVILRLAGLAGPERHPGNFLAGKVNLPGGKSNVNMVHQTDVNRAIESVLTNWKGKDVFNIVADKHPTRELFFQFYSSELGLKPPVFSPELPGNPRIIDNSKFKRAYDFQYLHPHPMEFPL